MELSGEILLVKAIFFLRALKKIDSFLLVKFLTKTRTETNKRREDNF